MVKHYARLTFSSINLLGSYESGGDNKITSYWKNDAPSQLRHFRYFEWHEADIHVAVYEKYFSRDSLVRSYYNKQLYWKHFIKVPKKNSFIYNARVKKKKLNSPELLHASKFELICTNVI